MLLGARNRRRTRGCAHCRSGVGGRRLGRRIGVFGARGGGRLLVPRGGNGGRENFGREEVGGRIKGFLCLLLGRGLVVWGMREADNESGFAACEGVLLI